MPRYARTQAQIAEANLCPVCYTAPRKPKKNKWARNHPTCGKKECEEIYLARETRNESRESRGIDAWRYSF